MSSAAATARWRVPPCSDDNGQVDEVFSRHLTWDFSPLLYAAERGDTMFEFVPITEDEADQIITRIRESAEPTE